MLPLRKLPITNTNLIMLIMSALTTLKDRIKELQIALEDLPSTDENGDILDSIAACIDDLQDFADELEALNKEADEGGE